MIIPAALGKAPALSFLSEGDMETLGAFFREVRVAKGEPLLAEFDEADCLCLILSGSAKESRATEFPERRIVMGVYGPGSLLGGDGLFCIKPQPLRAEALEECLLGVIDGKGFAGLEASHPEVALGLLKGLAHSLYGRLNHAYGRMASVF